MINQSYQVKNNYCVVPELGADESTILAYKDHAFGDLNTIRTRRLENAARNLLYFHAKQWIELDTRVFSRSGVGYTFREMSKTDGREAPRPVFNFISGAVNIEQAALGRRQLTAKVTPSSRDPRVEAAAKVAQDILEDRLKKLDWADKREHFTFLTIILGLGIIKSYWDETYTELGFYDNPEAVACSNPECDTKLASQLVPNQFLEKSESLTNLETAQPTLDGEAVLNACPTCQEPNPLVPLSLTPDQASQPDLFGRPLGMPIPKGQTALEVISPFDYFPENSGIDVTWNDIKIHRQATPRSLDWILERYPELEDKIYPENPKELMEQHPVLGDWDIRGRYDSAMDADIYANHAMVYEIYQDRSRKFPNGRAIVIICDQIALDGELYRQVGQLSVPIVKYAGANWEPRHKEIWGKSLADDLISPQNVYNGLLALEIESMARTGSPNIILPNDTGADGPEFFEYYNNSGKVIRYNVNPLNPQAKPEILGGVTTPPAVNQAKNEALDAMVRIQGPTALEAGEAPKNVTTTSGLRLLEEQSDKKRAYRERALISAMEKIWSHQLEMLWAFRVDEDVYEAESDDGGWELKQYDRMAIMGQTKVKIEKQSEVDKSIYMSEAVREALADGLYGGTGVAATLPIHARKRILELRGLPTDVEEDSNYQIELCKKRWVDFIDQGAIPVIDPSLDNFEIQWKGLGTFLVAPEGQRIANNLGWPQILKQIYGWEMRLQTMEAMDLQARQLYGTTDPAVTEPMYQQLQMQHQEQMAAWEQESIANEGVAKETGQPLMPMPPPQEPVPPVFLPGDKADHIYGIWQQMLMETGGIQPPTQSIQPSLVPDPDIAMQDLDNFLKFRAVVEAYRLLAMEKVMKDMMAMAPPAPGGPGGDVAAPGQPSAGIMGSEPGLGQLNTTPPSINN